MSENGDTTSVSESKPADGVIELRIDGAEKGIDGAEKGMDEDITLIAALYGVLAAVFAPSESSSSFLRRAPAAIGDGAASVKIGCRNSSQALLSWSRRGSLLRPLLVVSVGTITLLALTGLLVFMLFFVAATANAVVVSFLVSLAVAGGFLAFFLACITTVYVAALSLCVFMISAATISTIIAVLITAGWVGFFCIVWLAAQKIVDIAKRSVKMTGSAVSAYSGCRQPRK